MLFLKINIHSTSNVFKVNDYLNDNLFVSWFKDILVTIRHRATVLIPKTCLIKKILGIIANREAKREKQNKHSQQLNINATRVAFTKINGQKKLTRITTLEIHLLKLRLGQVVISGLWT